MSPPVGVVGASARAAVHSLARAGLAAWALDLFADRDLDRVASCAVCPMADYPTGFPRLAERFPPGPVMYTGGLENHPTVVAELAAARELWGNPPDVLERVRDPFLIAEALEPRGYKLTYPGVYPADAPPADGYPGMRLLLKPRRGAAGHGIRFWTPGEPLPANPERWYLQEFVDGVSMSAVLVTRNGRTALIGITEQLVGEPWLHAPPFGYCGSIGPAAVHPVCESIIHHTGDEIATAAGLRDLWGFDFIHDVDIATYPVEVNPRYTASVEVLEHATGAAALASGAASARRGDRVVGKAVYYAPHTLTFPAAGPWDADLTGDFDPWRLPAFADIPEAGSAIEAGQPVLTILVSGSSAAGCRERLQSRARELDQLLSEPTP